MTARRNLRQGALGLALAGFLLVGCADKSAELQKQASEIAKGVEDYLALVEQPTLPVRVRHDKVTVTPAEDGKSYLVAITGLRYGTEKDTAATLGEIDYRLTPQDGDQYQVSDLKVPKEMTFSGADGKPIASVKFETTAFSGIWSKPVQNFVKFDWQVKDIAVSSGPEAGDVVKVATAAITGDGKTTDKGLLDQVSKVVFNGLTATDPTDGTDIKLDKLTGTVAFEHMDFPAYRKMMSQLSAFTAKYAPAEGAAPAKPSMSDEDRKAMVEMVRGFPKLMSAYSYDFSGEGLTIANSRDAVTVHLAQAGMGFGLKGIDTDKAELAFNLKHDGLSLEGPPFEDPIAKAVVPKSGNLALVASDIPVPSLVEGIAQALPDLTSPDAQVAQGAQFMLMGSMMSALSKSTLNLKIEPSAIETEKARLTADGALKLAMQTPNKAVGAINLALFGLDDLMALATSLANESPDAAQAVGFMQMLKGLAARETGGDGKPVDKYKVDLTEAGAVLINGKPLDSIAP